MTPVRECAGGNRVQVEEEASDACTQGREPTHQDGSFKQQPRRRGGKLEGRRGQLTRSWKPSSQRVLQQPVGGVGRTPEQQSHQRDDQAVMKASDSERDRVKSYISVWDSAQTS